MTHEDLEARLAAVDAKLAALIEFIVDQRTRKDFYTTTEVAKILNRDPFTVREWARYGRVHAVKRRTGRGLSCEWAISHDELERIRNHGLLPLPPRLAEG